MKYGAGVIVGAVGLAIVLLIGNVIAATLIGALCGWLVGLTPLGGMILAALAGFGYPGISLPDLGALAGFVSGFFGSGRIKREA
jgi:uncharacterized membrane protein